MLLWRTESMGDSLKFSHTMHQNRQTSSHWTRVLLIYCKQICSLIIFRKKRRSEKAKVLNLNQKSKKRVSKRRNRSLVPDLHPALYRDGFHFYILEVIIFNSGKFLQNYILFHVWPKYTYNINRSHIYIHIYYFVISQRYKFCEYLTNTFWEQIFEAFIYGAIKFCFLWISSAAKRDFINISVL